MIKVEKKKIVKVEKVAVVEEVKEVVVVKYDFDGLYSCKIKKVDSEGIVHIIFSEPMID